MVSGFIDYIEQLILPLGAVGVFLASVIEEIIAIIPSSVVQLGAGFLLLGQHEWSFKLIVYLVGQVAFPAAFGVTLGSLLIYGLVYWGGKPTIDKLGRFFGLRWSDVERVRQKFSESWRDELIIFIGRALPIMPTVAITAFSGLLRIRLREYLLYTFLGTLVRALILGLIGWQVGSLYHRYAAYLDRLEDLVWATIILGLIVYVSFHLYRERSKRLGRQPGAQEPKPGEETLK